MTRSKPILTGTSHTLPFNKLSPHEFERLCLWLVEREGYERAEHWGAAGNEQGRDVIAWRGDELWAFQCKRVRSFGPQDALKEVDKVLELAGEQRPVGLMFVTTCDVSANTRQQARDRCADGELSCDFWTGTELDEKVKRHPDILKEFFIAGRDVIVYEGRKPISAAALLDACQAQVAGAFLSARHKYNPELYVDRVIQRDLQMFFEAPFHGSAPNCFLIVAPAGTGKTCLLCDLARQQVSEQPVLLLMGANTYVSGETGLVATIQNELEAASSAVVFRNAMESLHTLQHMAEELDRDALIFLDAINEYERPSQMRAAVEDLLKKTGNKRIKLVITCRDYYWGLFKGSFWESSLANGLPSEVVEEEGPDLAGGFENFTIDELEQALPLYLDHYNISGTLVGDAVEQCRHPLLLLFFCEAYRKQHVGEVEDIRLKELFDRYWSRKLTSIAERMLRQGEERLQDGLAEEVGSYLRNMASYMLRYKMQAIPLVLLPHATGRDEPYDNPRSICGRIRDEFIILALQEGGKGRGKTLRIGFVYEEFMEYVMAKSLIRDWHHKDLDREAILGEIQILVREYESLAQLAGVMVYLGLMLKEQRAIYYPHLPSGWEMW